MLEKIKKHKKIIFIICIISFVFFIKIEKAPAYLDNLNESEYKIFNDFRELSKWFIGIDNVETQQTYQLQPLYPILLIPSNFMDENLWVLILNYLFLFLLYIGLYMFTKRFIDTVPSLAISSIIILSVLPLAQMMIKKHPQLLGACLFTWFVYYFININIKDKKCYWGSSILFAMLIMTKYVFFYLSPFVLLWLFYCHRKQKVLSIKNIFVWFIPSSICFSLWSLRNIVLHGNNIQGMFGGYHGVLDLGDSRTPLLNLFPSTSRLLSMFTHMDLFQLFKIYFISILAIIIIIVFLKKYRLYYYSMYFDRKKEIFMMLLIFLLGVFIFFPGMTWNVEILIPKYFRYFLPVYAIFPFLLIYTYSRSWKKNYRLVLILYLFLFIYYFI